MDQEQRVNVNMMHNQFLNRVIEKLASPPSNPEEGQEYYDTTLKLAGVWNGIGWTYGDSGGAGPHFAALFGDSVATSYPINHALNSANVIAQVSIAATKKVIGCGIEYTDVNNVTLSFTNPPGVNELKVVIA